MGEWQGGLPHGSGVYLGKDRYEGNFLNGLKFGFGEETFSNGDKYVGNQLSTKASTSIAWQMDTESTFGLTRVSIRVILSRESDMDMGFGQMTMKPTRDTIDLIRSKALASISGKTNRSTKDSFETTSGKAMESSTCLPKSKKN